MCTLSSENPCLQVLKTSRKEHSRKEHSGSPNNADQQLMKCLTLTASTHAVLPSDGLSVSELLKLYLPSFSSIIPSIKPELCFQTTHPLKASQAIFPTQFLQQQPLSKVPTTFPGKECSKASCPSWIGPAKIQCHSSCLN